MAIKKWVRVWTEANGPVPVDEQGRKYHIHHLDGNRENNDLSNLKAVSLQEHYDIHLAQGDYAACWLLAQQLKLSKEVKAELSRQNCLKMVAEGRNPFVGGEMQRRTQKELVLNGTHGFLTGNRFCQPHSEETKAKISAAQKGKPRKGHPHSEETKRRISEARRLRKNNG